MPIHALSNQTLQEPVCKPQTNNLSFRASSVNNLEKTPAEDTFEKPKKRTGLWVALGVLSAAGIAIGVDFWKFEGKHCKDLWGKVRNVFKKEVDSAPATGTNSGNNQSSSNIVENTIEKFREKGKFDKGKALLNDGSTYTGEIVVNRKDGSKVLLEYKDGLIQKSTNKKNGETVWEKLYKRKVFTTHDENKREITHDTLSIFYNRENEARFYRDFQPSRNRLLIHRTAGNGEKTFIVFDTKNKRISEKDSWRYIYDDNGILKGMKKGAKIKAYYPGSDKLRLEGDLLGQSIKFYDVKGSPEAEITQYRKLTPNNLSYTVKLSNEEFPLHYSNEYERAMETFSTVDKNVILSERLQKSKAVLPTSGLIVDMNEGILNVDGKLYKIINYEGENISNSYLYEFAKNANSAPKERLIATWDKQTNNIDIMMKRNYDMETVQSLYDILLSKYNEKATVVKETHAKVLELLKEYEQKSNDILTKQAV